MHARFTQFKVLPGKLEDFRVAALSLIPIIRKQAGFRALVVMRAGQTEGGDVVVVSVWNTLADLRASEKNLFLYQAISRVVAFCEGFPLIREHEVIVSEFAAG